MKIADILMVGIAMVVLSGASVWLGHVSRRLGDEGWKILTLVRATLLGTLIAIVVLILGAVKG